MKRALVLIICTLMICLVPALLFGWEEDVHYGLTKWLAFKAGFSLDDAETVALGTQSLDDGPLYPAPATVFYHTCLRRQVDYSKLVQDHHFPSDGPVPGTPEKRAVAPGTSDNAATRAVRSEIQTLLPDQPLVRTLTNLGRSLHPMEDSWSHQGIPDMPPWPCSKELAWGHPALRGGYWSHDADITHLHVEDTLTTAGHVYQKMIDFLERHPNFRKHPPSPWRNLEPDVRRFAAADTKNLKRNWFQSQSDIPLSTYTRGDFLKGISIPNSTPGGTLKENSLFGKATSDQLTHESDALTKLAEGPVDPFVDHVLDLWVVQKNIDALMPVVAVLDVARGLKVEPEKGFAAVFTLSQLVLGMWLVRDHGVVAEMHHGFPTDAHALTEQSLQEALQKLQKQPLIDSKSLSEAVHGLDTDAPYTLLKMDNETYVVALQFNNAPHDAIFMTVAWFDGDHWGIKNIAWFAL